MLGSDQKVLGYLGRALSLELSAVQLYTTQARLLANWGLNGPSSKLQHEAMEEMQHVERVTARMLALGVAPNASQLRPAKLGSDLQSLLRINHEFEQELVGLYQGAVRHCARIGSRNDLQFFQELLEDEQRHAIEMAEWLKQLASDTGL
jgi:bacterioferritin